MPARRSEIEQAGAKCCLIPGDLTEEGFCETLVDKAVEQFGKFDILVSNAAHQRRKRNLEELSDEEIQRTYRHGPAGDGRRDHRRLGRPSPVQEHGEQTECPKATASRTTR